MREDGRSASLGKTDTPKLIDVSFILTDKALVTVRYDEPKPFSLVEHKLARSCMPAISGEMVLMELLDAVIDRNADILERAGGDMDTISHDIFEPAGASRTAAWRSRTRTRARSSAKRKGLAM